MHTRIAAPRAAAAQAQTLQPHTWPAMGRWLGTAALVLLGGAVSLGSNPVHAGTVTWSVGISSPGAVVQMPSQPFYPMAQAPVQVMVAPPMAMASPWPAPRYWQPPPPRGYGAEPWERHHHHHHHRERFDNDWRAPQPGWSDDRRGGGYPVQPQRSPWEHHSR